MVSHSLGTIVSSHLIYTPDLHSRDLVIRKWKWDHLLPPWVFVCVDVVRGMCHESKLNERDYLCGVKICSSEAISNPFGSIDRTCFFSKYTFEALSRRDYGNSGCQQNMQKQGILFFPSNRFVRFLFLICFELARKHARQCVSLHLCVCVQHESKLCFDETNDPFFCVFTHQQVANAFHIWTFHFFYSLQSVFFHITPFNLNAYNHRLLRIRCLISNFVSALFF